ncbi:MAG: hypothetical protein IPQ07_00755 [Myxococcales bacterium]|nr:hypothetical protein [Myxococcales bacterium]
MTRPRAGLVIGLVIALATLGTISIRVVVSGRRALAAGDAAAERGDLAGAIAEWEAAARWYLPMAPHVDEAYTRLTALAGADRRHALAAWRAVRSAALATRGLWTPHGDDLRAANEAIAELASRDPEGAVAGGADAAARKVWHAERLARMPGPSRAAVVVSVLGIAAFLAGVGLLLRRRGPGLVAAGVMIAGTVGWIVGLTAV